MALTGVELHHHGIRINPENPQASYDFYAGVLGLSADPGRPDIPEVPGWWMDCANDTQIHLMAMEGVSPFAESAARDPVTPHVALAVPDLEVAMAELEADGIEFWGGARATGQMQIYVRDPSGNMLEIHEIGACRCKHTTRPTP